MKDHITPQAIQADPDPIPTRPVPPRGRQPGMTVARLRELSVTAPAAVSEETKSDEKEGGEGVDHAEGSKKTRKPKKPTKTRKARADADPQS